VVVCGVVCGGGVYLRIGVSCDPNPVRYKGIWLDEANDTVLIVLEYTPPPAGSNYSADTLRVAVS